MARSFLITLGYHHHYHQPFLSVFLIIGIIIVKLVVGYNDFAPGEEMVQSDYDSVVQEDHFIDIDERKLVELSKIEFDPSNPAVTVISSGTSISDSLEFLIQQGDLARTLEKEVRDMICKLHKNSGFAYILRFCVGKRYFMYG
jgi:hypothetical protein